jgi:hypothetical protein
MIVTLTEKETKFILQDFLYTQNVGGSNSVKEIRFIPGDEGFKVEVEFEPDVPTPTNHLNST